MKKLFSLLKTRFTVLLIDVLMIPIAWYGAYWLRFNLGKIHENVLLQATSILPFLLIIQATCFWVTGLYRGIWSFASLPDIIRILKAVFWGLLISLLPIFLLPFHVPRSIPILYAWLLVSLLAGSRFVFRWLKNYHSPFGEGKRVLLVGAGSAGELLLRELKKDMGLLAYNPIAFIDDDSKKQGCEIHGVRVVGFINDIPKIVKKYNIQSVIIAIPSAPSSVIRKIVDLCEQAEVPFTSIPRLNDLVAGKVSVKTLRDVSIEDLLGRDQVTLNWDQISQGITGKKILISGGGGSIGSELCRQIANLAPYFLIIVDNSEFNLYSIDFELRSKFSHLQLFSLLIDVTDAIAIQKVMQKYQPDVVFHAAAYKHVPLLEQQARAAIRNNVIGTYNLVEAAVSSQVPTFVLISTDKAVNPTNIMGATKRAAEIICKNYNATSKTNFVTVRFGNVLGSAGSVVPLFKSQLEKGQDLTVTHPEIIRYFMTIPEACQLILQATVIGKGGEIFVLDMGEPIKIKYLAEQMIKLSGKKLGDDINIVYTGLRPGEKMYEELFYKTEELLSTEHEKILLAKHHDTEAEEVSKFIEKIFLVNNSEDELILKQTLFDFIANQKL